MIDGVEVAAVAARDGVRAAQYAAAYRIPASYGSYDALLADDSLDAVYIPLPNSLHGAWTQKAIAAGKHVLCEKPFTANADEARAVAAVAAASDRVVMEAFHYRYHPLTARALEVIRSGELGDVQSVDATLCVPMPPSSRNIRWSYPLGGGSMMDLGCYAVHMVRTLSGAEPHVESAEAHVVDGNLDRWLRTRLSFADGRSGSTTVAMWSGTPLSLHVDVRGTAGSMRVTRLISPQFFGRIRVRTGGGARSEGTTRRPSYAFQLEAFWDAVAGQPANLTPPTDSVATMAVIDDAYRAAGLPVRVPFH